ncbi:hypothetical protein WJX77_002121 [Trebouxia sp. C0004]
MLSSPPIPAVEKFINASSHLRDSSRSASKKSGLLPGRLVELSALTLLQVSSSRNAATADRSVQIMQHKSLSVSFSWNWLWSSVELSLRCNAIRRDHGWRFQCITCVGYSELFQDRTGIVAVSAGYHSTPDVCRLATVALDESMTLQG